MLEAEIEKKNNKEVLVQKNLETYLPYRIKSTFKAK